MRYEITVYKLTGLFNFFSVILGVLCVFVLNQYI